VSQPPAAGARTLHASIKAGCDATKKLVLGSGEVEGQKWASFSLAEHLGGLMLDSICFVCCVRTSRSISRLTSFLVASKSALMLECKLRAPAGGACEALVDAAAPTSTSSNNLWCLLASVASGLLHQDCGECVGCRKPFLVSNGDLIMGEDHELTAVRGIGHIIISWQPLMEALNTTSPIAVPVAPKPAPCRMEPSSNARRTVLAFHGRPLSLAACTSTVPRAVANVTLWVCRS